MSFLNFVKFSIIWSLRVGIDMNCKAVTLSRIAAMTEWISSRASVIVASDSPVMIKLPFGGIDMQVFVSFSRILTSQFGNFRSFA